MAGTVPSAGTAATFEFSGFDFSAVAQGAQAATFTELFAEVLHPVAPAGQGPESGSDLHAELTVGFEDAMRGVQRQVTVTRYDACAGCGGSGLVRTAQAQCAHCHGTGTVRWARGHMVFTKSCGVCRGSGHQGMTRCGVCGGHGRHARTETVPVAVPAGVQDGARLRIAERGHAGRQGGRTGDLYVSVHVESHPVFRRHGDDLHVALSIGVHEAVLGTRVEVPSIDGPVKLRVPPGTRAGQRFRLRERGAPRAAGGRGDLIIETRLVLPDLVDERGKELMREFGRLYPQDIRRAST